MQPLTEALDRAREDAGLSQGNPRPLPSRRSWPAWHAEL